MPCGCGCVRDCKCGKDCTCKGGYMIDEERDELPMAAPLAEAEPAWTFGGASTAWSNGGCNCSNPNCCVSPSRFVILLVLFLFLVRGRSSPLHGAI
ncbi:hypothetical protein DFJ73DRAFT_771999 [Zopfochytrium polystomum]|nr:hypothetical protein DFJ73DRAFT_771999 [Zopfochytrium polystomum]